MPVEHIVGVALSNLIKVYPHAMQMYNIKPSAVYIAFEHLQVIGHAEGAEILQRNQLLACVLRSKEEAADAALDVLVDKVNSNLRDNCQRIAYCLRRYLEVLQHTVTNQLMQRCQRTENRLDIRHIAGQLLTQQLCELQLLAIRSLNRRNRCQRKISLHLLHRTTLPQRRLTLLGENLHLSAKVLHAIQAKGHHLYKIIIIFFRQLRCHFRQTHRILINPGQMIPYGKRNSIYSLALNASLHALRLIHYKHSLM